MRPCERFSRGGFTLLEVMAAVAVLGLVYVVVARGAMQGLQTEGDASRRLRASLLADRVLNDLELNLAGGSAPALGETETSEEEFTVVVEVSPFDLATLLETTNGEPAAPAASTTPLELLKPPVRGGIPTLLMIAVRVAWMEGISEQEVTRTSFAFDLEAAAPLLEAIQSLETAPEGEAQGTAAEPEQPGTSTRLQQPGASEEPPQ
jgi:prepilin-type N-terminal cleavage/methylation domain-containing protein